MEPTKRPPKKPDKTRHLRVVTKHSETRPPKVKKHPSRFSDRDRQMLVIALRALKMERFGTWWRLAQAMKVAEGTLHQVAKGKSGSMGMAVRAAAIAGVPVEVLLSGRIRSANRCPACNQVLAEPFASRKQP
jgi:hypothetical protein